MYAWFEEQARQGVPQAATRLKFQLEPTVTPGVKLARVLLANQPGKPLVRTDVRPEGVRMHFPLAWQAQLSDWSGVPPDEAYRLKSNWVNQPSIGVAVASFDPYFKNLAAKIIEILKRQ